MVENKVGQDQLPITSVVSELKTNLGERLTALIAGTKNVRLVEKWVQEKQHPNSTHEWRLRLAHRITQSLHTPPVAETPDTIRSWFMGMDPLLEDKAPAIVIADAKKSDKVAKERVLRAAMAFLAE